MRKTAALMFGTDVVSCTYADHWNSQLGDGEPVVGFIAANGDRDLDVFRPDATVVRDHLSLVQATENQKVRILFPEYRRQDVEMWAKSMASLPAATELVALPAPPDYVIQWMPYSGSREAAFAACEGYDSIIPTQHAVASQNEKEASSENMRTAAQTRQVKLVETLANRFNRPLRVIDFGGAAGGHFITLDSDQRDLIESWTVVETPQMAKQARESLDIPKLNFIDNLEDVSGKPDLILASSSLQYVDDFDGYFEALLALEAEFLCIDRTPMGVNQDTPIFLQRVFRNQGPWCYETSYPMFLHPESKYMTRLAKDYHVHVKMVLRDESPMSDDFVGQYYFVVASRIKGSC